MLVASVDMQHHELELGVSAEAFACLVITCTMSDHPVVDLLSLVHSHEDLTQWVGVMQQTCSSLGLCRASPVMTHAVPATV